MIKRISNMDEINWLKDYYEKIQNFERNYPLFIIDVSVLPPTIFRVTQSI